jgi:hypothetical protein
MHKKGSTLYPEAKKMTFDLLDKEYGVPAIYEELKRELPAKWIPPQVNYIYRYRNDWEKQKIIREGLETLVKEETPDTQPKPLSEESGRDSQLDKRLRRPSSLRDKELVKPPSLTELIDSGVPKKLAPELLANWEIAFREDNYVQARTYEKAAMMLREIPGIPYKKALDLGKFEAKLEYFGIDGLKQGQETFDLINIYKRYRPWEGKENQKAYQKMFNWWFEKTKPLRDKLRAEAESSMRNWLNTTPSTDEGK